MLFPGFLPKARFYCVNILEEIDTPSEVRISIICITNMIIVMIICHIQYYVNRSSGVLYFYPPPQWKTGQVCNSNYIYVRTWMYMYLQAFVSVGESIIEMNYVSNVTIQGLEMLYSRRTAVEANGGY